MKSSFVKTYVYRRGKVIERGSEEDFEMSPQEKVEKEFKETSRLNELREGAWGKYKGSSKPYSHCGLERIQNEEGNITEYRVIELPEVKQKFGKQICLDLRYFGQYPEDD